MFEDPAPLVFEEADATPVKLAFLLGPATPAQLRLVVREDPYFVFQMALDGPELPDSFAERVVFLEAVDNDVFRILDAAAQVHKITVSRGPGDGARSDVHLAVGDGSIELDMPGSGAGPVSLGRSCVVTFGAGRGATEPCSLSIFVLPPGRGLSDAVKSAAPAHLSSFRDAFVGMASGKARTFSLKTPVPDQLD